ncbi:MAG: SurA N-terminal domain-containing protein [Candidatus Accumulibacter sp.]|jgi:peptidyl-prolyl cis-trans isomerase D|nr:SurA N-terminal domain-containing protein [Accumulibacter sp.]
MFDAVRNNPRIVQIFLGLITLPFAFWGIESYIGNLGAGGDLASVGDTKITYPQFEQAVRERQDLLRQSLGETFRPDMMNSPQVRLSILNGLIDQRLLLLEAANKRLMASDPALRSLIVSIPAFQENGAFSQARYEAVLRAQGSSPAQFEARARQDLSLQQLLGTIDGAAFVSATQAETMLRIQAEERKFNEFRIAAAPFAKNLKIDLEVMRKFYDDNISHFEVPEQVKAEYVVLSLDTLMSRVAVSDAEIRAWYDDHPDRYRQPEERRASHILITPGEAGMEKAQARAEELLKDVRQNPSRFAELAKKYSQDPGSAEKGGDLGFFGRGMMVKSFDDAVFGLKKGDISDVVESDFGYHIIRLTDVREAKQQQLSEVHAEIEDELKRQAANREFAEAAEAFNNLVYEQSDSLQPVADQFGLKIERSGWIPRNADPSFRAALGVLDNDRVLTDLFSEDALRNKRNTEAVEVAPNTLLAARVVEHFETTIHPFEAVGNDIEKILKNEQAQAQARSAGEAALAELREGKDTVAWSATHGVSRIQAAQSSLPAAALQALFKANVQKLPAYVGVEVDDGYRLFRITAVAPPEKVDENRLEALKAGYTRIVAQEDFAAYLSSLRSRYKVDINLSLLENRDR